jgi:hypothetical protein
MFERSKSSVMSLLQRTRYAAGVIVLVVFAASIRSEPKAGTGRTERENASSTSSSSAAPTTAPSQPSPSQKEPEPANNVTNLLETTETFLQIVAYLIGAGWVYFNFFKGRTYRPRLELKITGQLSRTTTPQFAVATLQVKNVGLSKVDVSQKGTAIRVLVFDPTAQDQWKHIATVSLLQAHQWIEPSEALEEQSLVPMQLANVVAVRIEAIITGKETMWETFTIVT